MRPRVVAVTFLLGLLAIAGAALATPGIGVLSAPVHARGTIEGDEPIRRVGWNLFLQSFRRGDSTDVVTQQITIAPGGTTGWHGHPGPVFVTVKSGALTIVYADDPTCQGTTYTAGQSFIDFGNVTVHTALSSGPTPLELWATYLVPGTPGAPFRIDSPNTSNCNF
jgi:hypothetical protein